MTQIIKVKNEKDLDKQTENYIIQGFKIENKTNNMTTLIKQGNYGNPLIHIIIFVLFGWWTIFIANIIYGLYCYGKTENVMIKVE